MNTKRLLSITATILLASGCNQAQNQTSTPIYTELPTVESKLDAQTINDFSSRRKQNQGNRYEGLVINKSNILTRPDDLPSSLFYDSGINISYPKEGVKGIYLPIDCVVNTEYFQESIDKLNSTALNSAVLDFKDDSGQILPIIESDNPMVNENVVGLADYKEVLKTFEQNNIYPIARIVTFKDNFLASSHPELSFQTEDGEIWTPDGEDYFTNPFLPEPWDYNVAVAIEAAKMGFKEVQFDYVRFSDAFMYEEEYLTYPKGRFENYISEDPNDKGEERIAAITEFLAYAKEKLAPYGVDVSADVFGYTAIANNSEDVRGIGQNFAGIADQVDVISSMVYPSHWDVGFFGLENPDLQPYDLINEYMLSEKQLLEHVNSPVTTRPWLQNFSYDSFYGDAEVQAQINALVDNGVYEYLLWNASGDYIENVDYAPEITAPQETESTDTTSQPQ